jgi:hypothetical protein
MWGGKDIELRSIPYYLIVSLFSPPWNLKPTSASLDTGWASSALDDSAGVKPIPGEALRTADATLSSILTLSSMSIAVESILFGDILHTME